jgi:hypothetical protein
MQLIWLPYWVILTLVVFVALAFDHMLDTRPLDDDLAYRALHRHLRRPEVVGNHLLDLSSVKMVERNGEAILVGKGSTRYWGSSEADVPVLESLNFEYIMIISRECHDPDAKCYTAQQVELTGEKSSTPLI